LASAIVDYGIIENNIYAVTKFSASVLNLIKIDRSGYIAPEIIAEVPLATNYYLGKIKNDWLVIPTLNNLSTVLLSKKVDGEITWQTLATSVSGKVLWDDAYLIYKQNGRLILTEWEALDKTKVISDHFAGSPLHFSFDTILYWENKTIKSIDLTGENDYDLLPTNTVDAFTITEPTIGSLIFIDAKTSFLSTVTLREKQSSLINF